VTATAVLKMRPRSSGDRANRQPEGGGPRTSQGLPSAAKVGVVKVDCNSAGAGSGLVLVRAVVSMRHLRGARHWAEEEEATQI